MCPNVGGLGLIVGGRILRAEGSALRLFVSSKWYLFERRCE